MGTTKEEIRAWLQRGLKEGATHCLVVVDTYDHGDYPVYVMPGENARLKANEYNGMSMQRVMECYSLKLDIEQQLHEHRAFHYDDPGDPPPKQKPKTRWDHLMSDDEEEKPR